MLRVIGLAVAVLALVAMMALAFMLPTETAYAAPIVCPSGQDAQKVGNEWVCVNNGGNTSGAGHHKGTGDKI